MVVAEHDGVVVRRTGEVMGSALWDVIDHYNKGNGLMDPYLDEDIQPLALQENEIDDLVASSHR